MSQILHRNARRNALSRRVLPLSLVGLAVCLAVGFAPRQQAEQPVSKFAPAEDLVAIADSYTTEAGTIAGSPEEFAKDDRRTRLGELAESIQLLTLALAHHDQLPAGKTAGNFAAAHQAAGELYAAADQAAAKAAFDKLTTSLAGETEAAIAPAWGSTDQMYDLMNQVQLSMNSVNRGMRRLERRPAPIQENSAFLAAVAHETNLLVPEDLNEELTLKWHEFAIAMRDSSAALNAAARAKDATAAAEAAATLTKSCEDCHAQIRDR